MFEIEQAIGISSSSYYFRLATADIDLMRAIVAQGGEVGYHFEELAAVAKRHRLRTPAQARMHLPEARELFRNHIRDLRARTGLPMRIVAAHGDFANRLLGVTNCEILADPVFRRDVGIDLEVYDRAFMQHVTSRHSDMAPPRYWAPSDPLPALARGEPVVYLLVHPRHWHAARGANAVDDLRRVCEGVAYQWRVPSRAARPARPLLHPLPHPAVEREPADHLDAPKSGTTVR